MKKDGILHPGLIRELTALGHFDSFVICDMGFPIPQGAVRIDLALVRGIPGLMQTLKAVIGEMVVQEAVLMECVKTANPHMHDEVTGLLTKQEIGYADLPEFRKRAADARFFIRTAEDTPCANILLVSASGVQERVDLYRIDP